MMGSTVEELRAKALELENKAASSDEDSHGRTYYLTLAEHWRTLALLREENAEPNPVR
jgi:hypothetical protein